MYSTGGNIIRVTRGDALTVLLKLQYKTGRSYVPESGDSIELKIGYKQLSRDRRTYARPGAVLTKAIPTDSLVIYLSGDETKSLPFEDLVYDVTIYHANGDPETVIEGKDFIVTKKV